MAQITLVTWRDIPAQIIAGAGRRGVKKALPERFEQAIDRCAMKVGAKDFMLISPSGAKRHGSRSRAAMPRPPRPRSNVSSPTMTRPAFAR